MARMNELVKKRGTYKGRLTKFQTYVDVFKDATYCTEVEILELKLRMSNIEAMFPEFEEVQTSIECLATEEEAQAHATQRSEFESQYFSVLAKAQERCNSYESVKKSSRRKNNSEAYYTSASENEDDDGTVKEINKTSVKLPIIQIPKYSGDYENWLEFRDVFKSLIHSNTNISDIQKFHYLRASLEGGAAQIIRALEFSASNYTLAWKSLCDRFDNTRLLVQNHVKAIFDEEVLKRESASGIRRVVDACNKNLRSLNILGEPTDSWDTLIIYIICTKLDAFTLREWEEHKVTHKKITLSIFTKFLKDRADVLETIELSKNSSNHKNESSSKVTNRPVRGLTTVMQPAFKKYKCPLCKAEHSLYLCNQFAQMNINAREQFVTRMKLCSNCLRAGHNLRMCRLGPCRQCGNKHNSLLHRDPACNSNATPNPVAPSTSAPSESTAPVAAQTAPAAAADVVRNMSAINKHSCQVLLATALVRIVDVQGRPHDVRAILDSGSQASFMTESLLATLGLQSQKTSSTVAGINNQVSTVNKRCDAIIQSRINSFKTRITFLVLPNITSTNNEVFNVSTLKIPSGIQLADPEYFSPSSYDLLLGADIFWDLLCANKITLGKGFPVLQETKFGYIVSGPTGLQITSKVSCNFTKFDEIQDQLAKFWQIEEVPAIKEPVYTTEEDLCEQHFIQNVSRKEDGRFSVGIPLKDDESKLGHSFQRAKSCFLSLERRLLNQPSLRLMYVDFMNEYLSLGHMSLSDINNPHENSYFMPHHGVLREQSTTTKLRVVFNASAPTSSGLSCNDLQMVGPTIQSDLLSILLRFRQHRFVMAGDIEKMYRQVLVNENQRHLQQIIWRDDPSKPLQTYALNTVTYGTASAPFLSVRCLKQIADECENELVRKVISEDCYVDDLLTGQETAASLMELRALIAKELASGCFNLRKFRSNLPTCSDGSDSDISSPIVDLSEHEQAKTLGLQWSPSDDVLKFDIKTDSTPDVTKRVILSTISQVFDPLGLLSIFIIVGKIILQKIWLHKVGWDSPLPLDIVKSWIKFVTDLGGLQNLRIPRHVVCENPNNIQIHVFCDSSKDAYGACAYVRSTDSSGNVSVLLLCSKTRVAPIKAVTIPRLELCGSLVAARLLERVLQTTRLHVDRCFLWTDSSVVLGWLKTPPNKLKPFVKNRVAEIQELTKSHFWRHVPTASNPADLLSRGISAAQSDKLDLWFHGPKFLQKSEALWPNKTSDGHSDLPEVRSNVASTTTPTELFPFLRFSSLSRLKNTMAFVLRFISNCQRKTKSQGPLTLSEKQSAFDSLVKLSQRESFTEYDLLAKGKSLPSKNQLLSLSPFLDERGLIRVGGRIKNGNFTFEKKHPLLLLSKHTLTKLIFGSEHLRLMHAGPQLLLSSIREEFWPIGARNLAKLTVHKCQRCFRLNAQTARPIMGNLPEQRLQPGYPFQTTGMDYAGPLVVLNKRGRGSRTEKVYIAMFICFATKCIHLELVSSLSKESFISTLHRFIARRSKPATLISDNGTQFVGARNELSRFFNSNADSIISDMSNEHIDFKFIPAYAAHMGGLWEANIKCIKAHLHRVLGNAHLVFEDFYTVLVQIEAVLNSRPLTPLSTDPHDMTPLTPGHFLVGRPMTALPTPSLVDATQNRLSRFERLEQLRQHFWARWSKEYIAELQQRTKWRTSKGQQLQKGALVLIKEEGLPPMKWRLGRIMQTYPGTDGIARVADINTSRGVIRRGFNRICPLPTSDDDELKVNPFNAGGHVRERSTIPTTADAPGRPAAAAAQTDHLQH